MSYKNTFLAVSMLALAAALSRQEYYQVSGAAVREPRKRSNNRLFKGSTKRRSSKKKGSKKSGSTSSSEDSPSLCYLEVSGFDPYREHMKYYKNVDFYVQLSNVPNSRSVRFQVMKQAQISLQDALVKHFEKNSFQRQINNSTMIQSFEFDPAVDLEVGIGYGYHWSRYDGDKSNIDFRSVFFSGIIEYLCTDFEDNDEDQLLWELASILDNQISSSKTTLYRQFYNDFQQLDWNFEDIDLIVSIA